MPSNPNLYYPDWPGWPWVLGRGERSAPVLPEGTLPFETAAEIARAAG